MVSPYLFGRRVMRALRHRVDVLRERRVRHLSPSGVHQLIFGQRHVSTDALFFTRSGSRHTVVEVGSNIGGNCLVAGQMGCSDAFGLEMSPALVTAAIRLNTVFPRNCRYAVYDLYEPLPLGLSADSVFYFSVFAHLRDTTATVDSILRATKTILNFEARWGERLGKYDYFLNSKIFSSIECVGSGVSGIQSRHRDRSLFRCVRRSDPS